MTNALVDTHSRTDPAGAPATGRTSRLRTITVVAGVTLAVVLAALLALVTFPGAAEAQVDVSALIRAIVCPILNALANGPLGGLIGPILNSLAAAFGCGAISG